MSWIKNTLVDWNWLWMQSEEFFQQRIDPTGRLKVKVDYTDFTRATTAHCKNIYINDIDTGVLWPPRRKPLMQSFF